jgi:hypothetical protein
VLCAECALTELSLRSTDVLMLFSLWQLSADTLAEDKPQSAPQQQQQQQQQRAAPALAHLCITREFTAYMRENGFRLPDYLQRADESHTTALATTQQQQQWSKRAQQQQQPAKQKPATAAVAAASVTAVAAVAAVAVDAAEVTGESTDVAT